MNSVPSQLGRRTPKRESTGRRPCPWTCQRRSGGQWRLRDLSTHDCRRTWATLLAGEDGIDALLVWQWGGWVDLETFLNHYHGAHSPEVQRQARESVEWL